MIMPEDLTIVCCALDCTVQTFVSPFCFPVFAFVCVFTARNLTDSRGVGWTLPGYGATHDR
jgi:hypothetical protein